MTITKIHKQPDPPPVEKVVVEFTAEEWSKLKYFIQYRYDIHRTKTGPHLVEGWLDLAEGILAS